MEEATSFGNSCQCPLLSKNWFSTSVNSTRVTIQNNDLEIGMLFN